MINYNGNIIERDTLEVSVENRALNYGDAVFETIRVVHGKLMFWESHYFRLMASMRVLRMEIPMSFTMEFLEEQILNTLSANELLSHTARVKLIVNRVSGGLYLPERNDIDYLISVRALDDDFYIIDDKPYEIDLFKDYFIAPSLISTLKTNNRIVNVLGSIFAKENDLQNCLILNTNKHVVEALNGNLFIVKDGLIRTPPLADGCLNGIMRKQVMDVIEKIPELQLQESTISPFELQKADELFITNVIVGIQSITKYRKKEFKNETARTLINKVNAVIRLLS